MNHLVFSRRNRSNILSLCEDFKEISRRTWYLLKNADEESFSIGEETITDINLLELKLRQPAAIFTKQVSKYNESIIGADWLWAIVGRTGRTFILYVQAKKFFVRSGKYESLIDKTNPFHQVNNLISNQFIYKMLGIRMYPIYIFYNYFPEHRRKLICNCLTYMDSKLAGCSYADALQVKNLIRRGHNDYAHFYPIQFSWSCLVCCGSGSDIHAGNNDLATSFFNRIIGKEFVSDSMRENNVRDFSPDNLLLEEPPRIIDQIINGEEINEELFIDLNISKIVVLDERRLE